MAGPNCQAGRGKDGAAMNLGLVWVLYKRKVKEVSAVGLFRGSEFLLRAGLSLGVSQVRAEDKMATDL
jgi:hypothetical protein